MSKTSPLILECIEAMVKREAGTNFQKTLRNGLRGIADRIAEGNSGDENIALGYVFMAAALAVRK